VIFLLFQSGVGEEAILFRFIVLGCLLDMMCWRGHGAKDTDKSRTRRTPVMHVHLERHHEDAIGSPDPAVACPGMKPTRSPVKLSEGVPNSPAASGVFPHSEPS